MAPSSVTTSGYAVFLEGDMRLSGQPETIIQTRFPAPSRHSCGDTIRDGLMLYATCQGRSRLLCPVYVLTKRHCGSQGCPHLMEPDPSLSSHRLQYHPTHPELQQRCSGPKVSDHPSWRPPAEPRIRHPCPYLLRHQPHCPKMRQSADPMDSSSDGKPAAPRFASAKPSTCSQGHFEHCVAVRCTPMLDERNSRAPAVGSV